MIDSIRMMKRVYNPLICGLYVLSLKPQSEYSVDEGHLREISFNHTFRAEVACT